MSSRHYLALFALGFLPLGAFYFFKNLLAAPFFEAGIQSLPYINALDAGNLGLSTRGVVSVLAAGVSGCVWFLSQRCYQESATPGAYLTNVVKIAAWVVGVPLFAFVFALNYLGLRADLCLTIAMGLGVFCYRRSHFAPTTFKTQGGGRIDR